MTVGSLPRAQPTTALPVARLLARPIPLPDPPWARALKLVVLLGSVALITLAVLWELHLDLGRLSAAPVLSALSITLGLVLALRLGLWLAYRPSPAISEEALPSLTVVVPAYNEGPGVVTTLVSLLTSRYPRERLQVIAVDDGSKDDTGAALDLALERFRAAGETRLEVIHLPQNQGKRGALYTAFARTTTELVATIDSDSMALPDTLRCLVAPFADRRVAGVAGRVMVWNRYQNLLTRMLHVRYLLGFDFVRAYQSQLGTVWCCPGALQAYRRTIIAPHLDLWRDQRFLGARCTNGDDHALTNLVLSLGYDTRYQSTAEVYTLVPERYPNLCRMYLRWGRSATREGLRALRFVPRRLLAKGPLLGPAVALDALTQPVSMFLRFASVLGGAWLMFASPPWLLRTLLVSTLLALPYALVYLRSERSSDVLFGILYGWFALLGLFWVQPLAILTVRGNGWLTRG